MSLEIMCEKQIHDDHEEALRRQAIARAKKRSTEERRHKVKSVIRQTVVGVVAAALLSFAIDYSASLTRIVDESYGVVSTDKNGARFDESGNPVDIPFGAYIGASGYQKSKAFDETLLGQIFGGKQRWNIIKEINYY